MGPPRGELHKQHRHQEHGISQSAQAAGILQDGTVQLTEREQEILTCLVRGLSNKEIAGRMHLALRTVKWYNSQIFSKLGVKSRLEAVALAQRLELNDAADRRPSHEMPRRLPEEITPFLGRQREMANLVQLLTNEENRLITILAPGGMGKTRLAIAVAAQQEPHFADGVFFVSLAPLSAASAIVMAIAESIDFSFFGEDPPLQQLKGFLRDRAALLVLDNFEHLLHGAPMLAEILQAAPNVRILATSRERLNLRGETVFHLDGLGYPPTNEVVDVLKYDAAELFLRSARRARADFVLGPADHAALSRICRLCEGMPLGVELAAGWVNTLSLSEIADEIQQGIDIFETDLSDVPDRHRSVRTTFERTWDWLTEGEKAAYARLSVFRGGFTKQAALTVAETHVRTLRRLAQKALIRFEGQDRYAIHELLRQFGASKLSERGDLPSAQARQARHFMEFMADRKRDIKADRPLEALTLIEQDFENVRTAWSYLVRHQHWTDLPAFLFSLWFYCKVRARGQDAIWLLEQTIHALHQSPLSAETELALAQVMTAMAWFHSELGYEERAAATVGEALRILRRHDNGEALLFGLYVRHRVAAHHFQPDVVVDISKEGTSLSHALGDQFWEGLFLPWAGAGPQNGEVLLYGDTLHHAEKAVSIFRQMGNHWGIMVVSVVLGMAYLNSGLYEQAQRCLEDALAIAQGHRDTRRTGNIHGHLAWIAMAQEDFRTAHMLLRKKLRAFWNVGYGSTAQIVYEIARVYAAQRDDKSAAAIIATIEHLPMASSFATRHLRLLRQDLQNRLQPEEFEAAWTQGRGRPLSELVSELLSQTEFQDEVIPSSGPT